MGGRHPGEQGCCSDHDHDHDHDDHYYYNNNNNNDHDHDDGRTARLDAGLLLGDLQWLLKQTVLHRRHLPS